MVDLVQNSASWKVVVVAAILSAMSEIDFFITSTGIFYICIWLHMKILLNFPVGGNIGHSDTEFEGSQGKKNRQCEASEDPFVFFDGHSVIVLALIP